MKKIVGITVLVCGTFVLSASLAWATSPYFPCSWHQPRNYPPTCTPWGPPPGGAMELPSYQLDSHGPGVPFRPLGYVPCCFPPMPKCHSHHPCHCRWYDEMRKPVYYELCP
jgi:hypothetical protein